MKQTKERILTTSLDLFNEFGQVNVSQRKITKEMGISPGNLTYHFQKKEDIETTLYFELVSLLDHEISELDHQNITLSLLMDLSNKVLRCFYEYRFIMLDFVNIMRTNRIISEHYKELSILRQAQFMRYMNQLISDGIFRKEELPNEFKNLYTRIQIISDFWVSHAEIEQGELKETYINKYEQIIYQAIYPYLTIKGKGESNIKTR